MQRLPIPLDSYSDIEVTLSGNTYTFTYRFNERNSRWKVDIKDNEGGYVVKGLTLIEETSQTVQLPSISLDQGMLITVRLNADNELAGRYNTGIDKNYEFIYVTYAELEEGS